MAVKSWRVIYPLEPNSIKVAVLRPVQVPMRENDLQTLATRLAHIYPVQERRPGGSGVALMNPAVRKSVIVEMPRLLISEDYVPDTNRSVESIETALNEAIVTLAMKPPFPFGIIIDGVASGDIPASEAITSLLGDRAKNLIGLADQYQGSGIRSVYQKDGRRYDLRLEILMADPSKYYLFVDANNFGRPANDRPEIIAEVRRVIQYFSTDVHQAFDSLF